MPYSFPTITTTFIHQALTINTVLLIVLLISIELSQDEYRKQRQSLLLPVLVLFCLLVAYAIYQMFTGGAIT